MSRPTLTDRLLLSLFLIEYTHFVRPPAPGGPMAALDLRPLSLGELLDRTFFLYRRHFLLFLGIAAVPYLLVLIPVLVGLLLYGLPGRSQVPSSIMAVAAVVGVILIIVVGLAVFVAFLYLAGASVFARSEVYS